MVSKCPDKIQFLIFTGETPTAPAPLTPRVLIPKIFLHYTNCGNIKKLAHFPWKTHLPRAISEVK